MARWSSAKRSRSLSRVSSSSKNKSKLPAPRVPEPDADRHSRRGGRGEEWSGDACVAHGGQGRSGRGTGRRATQGSPPHIRTTPAPTDCKGVRRVINKEYKG